MEITRITQRTRSVLGGNFLISFFLSVSYYRLGISIVRAMLCYTRVSFFYPTRVRSITGRDSRVVKYYIVFTVDGV